jgi:hypothetical protein
MRLFALHVRLIASQDRLVVTTPDSIRVHHPHLVAAIPDQRI